MAEAMREATALAEQTRSQCGSLINEKRALESALNRVRTSVLLSERFALELSETFKFINTYLENKDT